MAGRKPARVLPAPVAATSKALRPVLASCSIWSWWRRGRQPLDWNQSVTTGGRGSVFSLVSPLAPAPLFLPVQLVGRLFRAPRLACRVTSHPQPDQTDQEDRWSDDLQDPQGGFVHPLPPVPGTARRFTLYSSRWRDWVPGSSPTRKASMSGPPTHGSIHRSPSPRRSSRMAIATTHAAAMARC